MPDTSAIEFWSCDEGDEHLIFTDISEAVEAWADQHKGPLPEMVTVYGFARRRLPDPGHLAIAALEMALEYLDEQFGNPDEYTDPTAAMGAAALTFAEAIQAEYTPWTCTQVAKRIVRVADHVPAEWLTPTTGDT